MRKVKWSVIYGFWWVPLCVAMMFVLSGCAIVGADGDTVWIAPPESTMDQQVYMTCIHTGATLAMMGGVQELSEDQINSLKSFCVQEVEYQRSMRNNGKDEKPKVQGVQL